MRGRALWLAKEGSHTDEWEDACGYSESRGTFSVADGASSAPRAHEWASQLVASFVLTSEPPLDLASFERCVNGAAQAFMSRASQSSESDAWYVREAASRSSYATFLGLRVRAHGRQGAWEAVAVGDTCLFRVREGKLLGSFPLQSPDEFNPTPSLIPSSRGGNASGLNPSMAAGACRAGDVFLLASDALAQWALATARDDASVWYVLASIRSTMFRQMVADLRATGAMVNDDVTLLRCCMTGDRG